jgi:hypothetical protein
VVVLPLLVIATVAWRLRRQSVQEYPLTVERGRTQGIPALDEGNFDKANQLLAPAKRAVVALGGAVEGADDIRQAADEAAIFVNLLAETPEDLLAEAGKTDPVIWPSRFETLYKKQAIVVDSWITAEPGLGGTGYDIAYRVLPPGEASNFRDGGMSRPLRVGSIDFSGFQLFELARPTVGQRVTFGARLASFQYDGNRDLWVIRLEPKSGVFITHTKALEAFGWQSNPEALERQEDPK